GWGGTPYWFSPAEDKWTGVLAAGRGRDGAKGNPPPFPSRSAGLGSAHSYPFALFGELHRQSEAASVGPQQSYRRQRIPSHRRIISKSKIAQTALSVGGGLIQAAPTK